MATKKTSKTSTSKKLRTAKKIRATKPLTGAGAGKVTFNPFSV